MKLISESIEDIDYLIEDDESGKKNYKIRGPFLQAEVKNRNGLYRLTQTVSQNCTKDEVTKSEKGVNEYVYTNVCIPNWISDVYWIYDY